MRTIALVTITGTMLLLSVWIPNVVFADEAEQQVCDVGADYSLGIEDYSEAIRRHAELLRRNPDNALAHYHLGFALGMVGDRTAEVSEYQHAAALGLMNWDLFLNLGLAQLESGDLDAATDSLRHAVFLGGEHSESHFNLALVDQQLGMLTDAEHETLESLRLNPDQPDARNLLGVIYAQEGHTDRASLVWSALVRDVPDYEPARKNLEILGSPSEAAIGEPAAVVLPPTAVAEPIRDERLLVLPVREMHLSPGPGEYNGR